ncbi:MAG: ATP-binding protein [Thermodesulfovibrio sp.]|nr:ATP-binding protein [Thermodesulfovibrio sp.]
MEFYYITIITLLCVIIFILAWKLKRLNLRESFTQRIKNSEFYPQVITSENFETILKSITDGIIILDPRGNIIFSNKSFMELIKIEDPPEGKHFMEVIRNFDLLNLLRSSMIGKEEVTEEFVIKKGGEEIFISAKAIPVIAQEGSVKFLIVLLHDITKLKRLENIRRDFVANVSHELKTPVTAIKGYAETLLDGALNDKENSIKFLEIIKNQADRLNALVEDLLTLSRIEFGDIKIEKENIALEEVVNSVFNILKDKAQKKGILLQQEIPAETTIYADRQRMSQIFINLVDNAIKFTEKGFVKVKYYKENSKKVISVEDTGIGIPKEHLHRIGERFYRVDRARSRQLGGTGLGLAIVKHLVLAHGWQLEIESEVNKGTKVKIVIPEI